MRRVLDLIKSERYRQMNQEGWSLDHDDTHIHDELARAASLYALPPNFREEPFFNMRLWPWSLGWWKPTPNDRIRELVKAGALIVAEIERLQRLQKTNQTNKPKET